VVYRTVIEQSVFGIDIKHLGRHRSRQPIRKHIIFIDQDREFETVFHSIGFHPIQRLGRIRVYADEVNAPRSVFSGELVDPFMIAADDRTLGGKKYENGPVFSLKIVERLRLTHSIWKRKILKS